MLHLGARPVKGQTLFVIAENVDWSEVMGEDHRRRSIRSEVGGPVQQSRGLGGTARTTYMGIVKVSTDAGISGYSDMETSAPVAKACVDAPKWSQADGMEFMDGLRSCWPARIRSKWKRLWYRMYRGTIYFGPPGAAMQALLRDRHRAVGHCGKAYGQPVHVLLGGKWRDKVRAYGSTLFRPRRRRCGTPCAATLIRDSRQ